MYDPKKYRGQPPGLVNGECRRDPRDLQPVHRRVSSGGWLISVIIWAVIGIGLYQAFKSYQKQYQRSGQINLGASLPFGQRCEPLPANGNINVLDPSVMRRTDALYSGFKFDSELVKPVVLIISSTSWDAKYQSVAVHPGQSAQVNLPVGQYGVTILTGEKWCNAKEGFVNGQRVLISSAVEVKAGATGRMKIRTKESGQYNLLVSYQTLADQMAEKLPKQVLGNGFMDLRRDRAGNYRVTGTVNGSPVEFMVDTGASITSVGQQAAWRAGIGQCVKREFNTAAGKIMGCVGMAQRLSFGNFRIENVEVAVMPQLEGALLGMNVLGRVHIEQHGEVMRLSVLSLLKIDATYLK